VIGKIETLERLDLERVERIKYTGGDGKPATRNRSIGAPNITDAGLEYIAGLPKLAFIAVSKSKVTDRSCRLLSESKALETIGLDETQVTDRGLFILARVPTLKCVCVRRARVTEQGVAKFRIVRPDVQVLTDFGR